jgi:hypothetical protein
MDPNGRTFEAELVAQPVLEIALIGEMKCGGDVGEEDERRRRRARLRGVENPDVRTPRTRRRVLR